MAPISINGSTGISGVDGSAGTPALQGSDSNTGIAFGSDVIIGSTGGTERFRCDSSGRVLVGTSSAGNAPGLLSVEQSGGGLVNLRRAEAASSITVDELLGGIQFGDNAANAYADILGVADASAGTNDFPGRLVFRTCADGANTLAERMRITNNGEVLIAKTTNAFATSGVTVLPTGELDVTLSGGTVVYLNRTTNDGGLISFHQDGTAEGSISVSGTTVSYNGAHLSRWSQLPSGIERTEILRGSVLSNIDEMCEWGDEENEQLNRMKVSDVEGDKNVSGVFQAWDDDDDTYVNDFYCAMTGDFIIRIGAGVTVERGDLLMSAGDGTAKPQDDDIIRSKTIAKVTSTHVTCTYDDGSYCVPCVLMAC